MLENGKSVQSDILCISDNNYSNTVKTRMLGQHFKYQHKHHYIISLINLNL